MTYDPKGRSRVITDGLTRAGARAMLKAVGYTDEDLSRPIIPGRYRGHDVDILSVYEAIGSTIAGSMTPAELKELEDVACPGAGACGGQYTANTMATVMEAIGLCPLGTASVPAVDPRKDEIGPRAGELVMDRLRQGLRASPNLTRP